jgi:uncharacterized membrane protein
MKKLQTFLKTSIIGGLVVILPVAIMIFVVKWLLVFVADLIQPLTHVVVSQSHMQKILADIVVIAVLVAVCFMVGMFVKTRLGMWFLQGLESTLFKKAPGYSVIKETVVQLLGKEKSPFSTVALVQLFGSNTLVSAFVTDSHPDGSYTVFMPTGPNPTSGNIYHLEGQYVHPIDVPVEEAMRSIISCGAGSTKLINAYKNKLEQP